MMNKDISIKINRSTRMVYLSKNIIGNDAENLQADLVFTFEDDFVEGQARLEYRIDGEKRWVIADKQTDKYTVPVKSVMTKEGSIYMQLVVTEGIDENSVPIFKSNVFYMVCGQSINAELEQPEQYPSWIDIANTKLNQVDNLDIDATKEGGRATITVTKQDKSQQVVEILDGKDGEQGPKGEQGEQGIQGETGPKGDAYTLTTQDKTDIANETKEIVMPDLEKEITLVEDKAGNKITLAVDKNYLMTLKLLNSKGKELSTASVDLPLETMVVNARYDSTTKELVIVLENGNELKVPIGDLVKGLVSQTTFDSTVKSLQGQITANNDELKQVVGEVSDVKQDIISTNKGVVKNTARIQNIEGTLYDNGVAEGEFINIKDSALAEQQEVELDVNKAQETTEGYQLYNKNLAVASGDIIYRTKDLKKGSTYTYKTGKYYYAQYEIFDISNKLIENGINKPGGVPATKQIFKVPNEADHIILRFFTGEPQSTIENIDFTNVVLYEGTEDKPYEPYTGGIPSPNPNYKQEINKLTGSVEYTSCGKNLFDINKLLTSPILTINNIKESKINILQNNVEERFINLIKNMNLSPSIYTIWCQIISGTYKGGNLCFFDNNGKQYGVEFNFAALNKQGLYAYGIKATAGLGGLKLWQPIAATNTILKIWVTKGDYTTQTMPNYEPHQAISNTIDLKGNEVLPGDKISLRFNPMTGKYEKILKKNMGEEKKQNVTSVTIAKMKPNGKFYTNVGGILNEQTITFSKEIADLDVVYELKDDLKTEINLGEIDIMNMTYYPVTNAFTDKENVLINMKYYRDFTNTIRNLQIDKNTLQAQLQDIESRVKALESRPVALNEPIESEVMPNA